MMVMRKGMRAEKKSKTIINIIFNYLCFKIIYIILLFFIFCIKKIFVMKFSNFPISHCKFQSPGFCKGYYDNELNTIYSR